MKILISAILLAFTLFGCSNDNTLDSNHKETAKFEINWVDFISEEGGYKVSHPDYKVITNNSFNVLKEGDEFDVYMNIINTQNEEHENLGYSFNYTVYKTGHLPTDSNEIRERYKTLIAEKAEAVVGEVKVITFSDFKGVEMCEAYISLKHQPIKVVVRIFIVDQKEYELYVSMREENLFNQSASKFFNSFELI